MGRRRKAGPMVLVEGAHSDVLRVWNWSIKDEIKSHRAICGCGGGTGQGWNVEGHPQ